MYNAVGSLTQISDFHANPISSLLRVDGCVIDYILTQELNTRRGELPVAFDVVGAELQL